MKRLFKFRYPKLVLLLITIILSYYIFNNPAVNSFISSLGSFNYLSVFIAGMLFSFGFTAPFAVGFFLTFSQNNIWLAVIIGGLGSLIADLLIFKFIKLSFMDEFERLENTKIMKELNILFEKELGHKIKIYFLYAFLGIVLASPLPDEIGMIMLAGLTKINIHLFSMLTFILHALGILILLWI